MKVQLERAEALPDADTEELARVLLCRFGLLPRKRDGSAKMHKLVLELYERKKLANRENKPELAVLPVEEMASVASIKRQTMYEYLHRWLDLSVLKKTSFVSSGKVIIGYELNAPNLQGAFEKAQQTIHQHLEQSMKLIEKLQNEIKREKLRGSEEQPESTEKLES